MASSSLLTSLLGNQLGDLLADTLGVEPSDAELAQRFRSAFDAVDADGNGTLDLDEVLAAFKSLPMKSVKEADVRVKFERFDADGSGALDFDEFCDLMRASRSAARVDAMEGVIYCAGVLVNPSRNPKLRATQSLERWEGVVLCGGKLMNPKRNPAYARFMEEEAARMAELRALRPFRYEPWSILARAIAKPTVRPGVEMNAALDAEMRRRMMEDVNGFQVASDDESITDDESTTDDSSDDDEDSEVDSATLVAVKNMILNNKATHGNRKRTLLRSNRAQQSRARDISARERAWARLVVLRFLAAALSLAYIHPDEYFQSTEVAAADVLAIRTALPWEFTSDSPARSAIGPALACGVPYWLLRGVLFGDWLRARAAGAAAGAWARGGGLVGVERLRRTLAAAAEAFVSGAFSSDAEGWRWSGDMTPSPAVVLAPRMWLFVSSLLLDAAVDGAARAAYWCTARMRSQSSTENERRSVDGKHLPSFTAEWISAADAGVTARLVLASSWPVLTMQVRPFSNALESLALAVAVRLVLCGRSSRGCGSVRSVALAAALTGVVAAVGVWIRFTFVFLAVPLGLHVVFGAGAGGGAAKKALRRLTGALVGVAAFVSAAAALVAADTLYFRGGEAVARGLEAGPEAAARETWHAVNATLPPTGLAREMWRAVNVNKSSTGGTVAESGSGWVVSPWTSLAYNLRPENLATHGTHPRWLHAAVNAPLMFGPLIVAAYLALLASARRAFASAFKRSSPSRSSGGAKEAISGAAEKARRARRRADAARATLWCVLLLPLAALSTAPHQEARFLLPLVLPLAVLVGPAVTDTPGKRALWALFNVAGLVVYGGVHQSGVVPATAAIPRIARHGLAGDAPGTSTPPIVHAVYYRTYTPPRSLLVQPVSEAEGPSVSALASDAIRRAWAGRGGNVGDGVPVHDISSIPPLSRWRREEARGGDGGSVHANSDARVHVTDLAGAATAAELRRALSAPRGCPQGLRGALKRSCVAVLVAPTTAAEEAAAAVGRDGLELERVWWTPLHFSAEEVPALVAAFKRKGLAGVWDGMKLGVFRVKRR